MLPRSIRLCFTWLAIGRTGLTAAAPATQAAITAIPASTNRPILIRHVSAPFR
jgi:hypothetical protein